MLTELTGAMFLLGRLRINRQLKLLTTDFVTGCVMTNNPTIDGVSRELLEQSEAAFKALLKQITEEDEDGDYWRVRFESRRDQLRALLDAPVVERQPVACGQCGSTSADICNGNGCGYLESGNGEPEVAALQSTIAQLQARIAELESGRGEPVKTPEPPYKMLPLEEDGWFLCVNAYEAMYPLFTAPPAPVAVVLPPFAEKVISKLRRCEECFSDFESGGVDIGRHWLDSLTQLGLLNRVQRSPAMWEITQQGEDCLDATAALNKDN